MLFFRSLLNRIKNLIAHLVLPNSSLKMGKLDMQHEEMLAMLARQHERERVATKTMRENWSRDHAGAQPQDLDNTVRHFIRHDVVLRGK